MPFQVRLCKCNQTSCLMPKHCALSGVLGVCEGCFWMPWEQQLELLLVGNIEGKQQYRWEIRFSFFFLTKLFPVHYQHVCICNRGLESGSSVLTLLMTPSPCQMGITVVLLPLLLTWGRLVFYLSFTCWNPRLLSGSTCFISNEIIMSCSWCKILYFCNSCILLLAETQFSAP